MGTDNEIRDAIEAMNMSQEEKDMRDCTSAMSEHLNRRIPLRHARPYIPRTEDDDEPSSAEPMKQPSKESSGSDPNASVDSIEVGPSPRDALATPRMPILIRESPLSTKRERMRLTPHYRRPAPKVVKTAPPMRTVCHVMRDLSPMILYYDLDVKQVLRYPVRSNVYNKAKSTSFFEQSFVVKELLGKGSFGEVFCAQSLEDSFHYAVKVSIGRIRQACQAKYREISNHMKIPGHANIVTFVRAWEEADRLYIQTELCDMSLEHYCTTKHVLDEQEIWDMFIDILQAIHHLHEHQMIHDDIKPENIFLTDDKICKLGDFGLAIDVNNAYETKNTEEGDSKYLALEVLNSKPTFASDIFSLGMTILEAATDMDLPSNGYSWKQIRQENIPERFFDGVDPEMSLIIKWMLRFDPLQRPTTRQLLEYRPVKKRLFARRAFVKRIQLHNPPPAQQHTPVQNPEAALKVFSESLGGSALRSFFNPFDASDDDVPSTSGTGTASARRLKYPMRPLAQRLNFNDDDSDGQETTSTTTASSSSSSTAEPAPPAPSPQKKETPTSGRKKFTSRLEAALSGSGDGGFSQAERDAWQYAKYQRMMAMEQRLDREDAEDMVDESPYDEIPAIHARSCPPHAIVLSSGRRILKAPKLDFTLLDDRDELPHPPPQQPRTASEIRAAPRLDFSALDDSDDERPPRQQQQQQQQMSTPRTPALAPRVSIRSRIAAAERAMKEKK